MLRLPNPDSAFPAAHQSSITWWLLIALIVWFARGLGGGPKPLDPMEALKRRLAAGEINQEQYEQTRKALQG